jgi:hypothetical protein
LSAAAGLPSIPGGGEIRNGKLQQIHARWRPRDGELGYEKAWEIELGNGIP